MTWGQNWSWPFEVTVYIVRFVSTRQTRWHLYYCCTYKKWKKNIRGERISLKYNFFLIWWPLGAKPLTLGRIWRQLTVFEFNYLSNVVFGFSLAIIVPEIMVVFRNDVWQSRKLENFAIFLPCGPQFWPWRKIDRYSFVIIFDELFNAFFRFSLRPTVAEIHGGGGCSNQGCNLWRNWVRLPPFCSQPGRGPGRVPATFRALANGGARFLYREPQVVKVSPVGNPAPPITQSRSCAFLPTMVGWAAHWTRATWLDYVTSYNPGSTPPPPHSRWCKIWSTSEARAQQLCKGEIMTKR